MKIKALPTDNDRCFYCEHWTHEDGDTPSFIIPKEDVIRANEFIKSAAGLLKDLCSNKGNLYKSPYYKSINLIETFSKRAKEILEKG